MSLLLAKGHILKSREEMVVHIKMVRGLNQNLDNPEYNFQKGYQALENPASKFAEGLSGSLEP